MTLSSRILAYLQKKQHWTSEYSMRQIAMAKGFHFQFITEALREVQRHPCVGYLYDKGYVWHNLTEKEVSINKKALGLFEAL